MEQMFKVIKAQTKDGKEVIVTAVVSTYPRNYEALAQTLRTQRITLLEKGDEESKKEADRLATINAEMEKGDVVLFISKKPVDRLRYVALYKAHNKGEIDLVKELEWEGF